jgi:hypothetical protein
MKKPEFTALGFIKKEESNLHPLFQDICDSWTRDVRRTIDQEINNDEHKRLYERRGV